MRSGIKNYFFYFSGICIISVFLVGCARQGTLSGGPKDTRPPGIDKELSDDNFRTNYYPQTINLYFDEWIQLKNQSQVLISPPLANNPVISARGKHVEVVFDEEEVLRDSTTYAINFGNSIVDFTESNPLKNYRFVFATGDKIDSLTISFMVEDAYTGEPVDDVTIMLYDNYQDSVVYKEKPYYFAKTDKTGLCTIYNLRAGKFKCFALKDSNFDFLYNDEKEAIGFPDSLINVLADTLLPRVTIELFEPIPPLQISEIQIVKRGKLKLRLNQPVDTLPMIDSNMDLLSTEYLKDSIIYWYQPDTGSLDSLFLVHDLNGVLDTSVVKNRRNTPEVGEMMFSSFKSRKLKINPGKPAVLIFNQLVKSLDTSRMELFLEGQKPILDTLESLDTLIIDTLMPDPVYLDFLAEIDSLDKRKMSIRADFVQSKRYGLNIYPGAVNGLYLNTNDTLYTEINQELAENLGNIYCVFDSLDITQHYVVLLKSKDLIIDQTSISGVETARIEFLQQKPGNYYLEVIVDENRNGKWDPGNYELKKQSERKLEIKLDELRKGWDLETEIKWDGP